MTNLLIDMAAARQGLEIELALLERRPDDFNRRQTQILKSSSPEAMLFVPPTPKRLLPAVASSSRNRRRHSLARWLSVSPQFFRV